MECKLILEKGIGVIGELIPAKVEIKNTSKQNIVIDYNISPWLHLDLVVIDPKGKKISSCFYGDNYKGFPAEGRITLRHGETHSAIVAIQGNSDANDWTTPGSYKITAIFEYKGNRAVSKQVELKLTPK